MNEEQECLPLWNRWFLSCALTLARWSILRAAQDFSRESHPLVVHTQSKHAYTVVFWPDNNPTQSPLQVKVPTNSDMHSI
jgi:hypothetical protein